MLFLTWTYCGIIIPLNIKSIPSIDKINTIYSNGIETELSGFCSNEKKIIPYTIDEYKEKYGKLYWKE